MKVIFNKFLDSLKTPQNAAVLECVKTGFNAMMEATIVPCKCHGSNKECELCHGEGWVDEANLPVGYEQESEIDSLTGANVKDPYAEENAANADIWERLAAQLDSVDDDGNGIFETIDDVDPNEVEAFAYGYSSEDEDKEKKPTYRIASGEEHGGEEFQTSGFQIIEPNKEEESEFKEDEKFGKLNGFEVPPETDKDDEEEVTREVEAEYDLNRLRKEDPVLYRSMKTVDITPLTGGGVSVGVDDEEAASPAPTEVVDQSAVSAAQFDIEDDDEISEDLGPVSVGQMSD